MHTQIPIYFCTHTQTLNAETSRFMISPNTGQSERLDVETDGRDIALVAMGEEANDATIVRDGDVERLGLLDRLTEPKRSVGTQVGDDGEVGYAIASVTVKSVQPVNFLHELIRLKGNLCATQTLNVTKSEGCGCRLKQNKA